MFGVISAYTGPVPKTNFGPTFIYQVIHFEVLIIFELDY